MNWRKGNSMYYLKSDEGYTVSKSYVRSMDKWRYCAFDPTSVHGQGNLGCYDTAEEAKAVCEGHHQSKI